MRSGSRWLAAAAGSAAKRAKATKQPGATEARSKMEGPAPSVADFGLVFNPKGVDLDAFEDDMVRCLAAGADDYMTKPLSPQVYIEKLWRLYSRTRT